MKWFLLGLTLLVACSGSTAQNPETENGSSANETQTEPLETEPSDSILAERPCPLFCVNVDSQCLRPNVEQAPPSCGAFSMGQLPEPTEECPSQCCPPQDAQGDDPDADGLVGSADRCPDVPEDVDGFEDYDGCPDADNDNDGINDVDDRCCYMSEDVDGVEDEDGCPDPE